MLRSHELMNLHSLFPAHVLQFIFKYNDSKISTLGTVNVTKVLL